MLYITNRLYFCVLLSCDRSQITSFYINDHIMPHPFMHDNLELRLKFAVQFHTLVFSLINILNYKRTLFFRICNE